MTDFDPAAHARRHVGWRPTNASFYARIEAVRERRAPAYWPQWMREQERRRELRGYNPGQPRVPAGSPEGGRWTSAAGELNDIRAARKPGKALEAICLAQYARDTFHCTMIGSRACHAQAAERFAACLARKPIPPLNY